MRLAFTTLSVTTSLVFSAFSFAQDWNAIRGSDGLGVVETDGILSKTSDVDLKVRWKTKIGSGYSSVVVGKGIAVACYTDAKDADKKTDYVAGLDAATGTIKWKYSLGPTFIGKNGSFDGPLSTPTIWNGHVYGFSPNGRLFCLKLKTGEQVWARELKDEEKARLPMYGFTTSPIVVGDSLILQMGARDKSLAGFDLDSGKTKWAVGNDSINSQTPFKTSIGGRDIVLAAGRKKITGVDPNDGHVVFEYQHGGGNGSAMTPVPLGNDRFLLTLDDSYSKTIKLSSNGDKINVSEEWKERSIKNTYNIPVAVNGSVFAYSTRFLTCVDPDSGKPRWRSRNPGDGFLIAVDNHLIISTKKGSLHIAKSTSQKYSEIASAKVFNDLVWAIPAYSDNSVFIRSLGEIARVDIVARGSTATTTTAQTQPTSKKFSELLSQIKSSSDTEKTSALIDEFLKANKFPIVEQDVVHFVYRGKGTDVAVAGDVFGARQERKMKRVGKTDLFHYATKLPRDQRSNYIFLVDYKPQTDPLNPTRTNTSTAYAGEMEFAIRLAKEGPLKMSWFAMSDWKQPFYLPHVEKTKGTVDKVKAEVEGKTAKQNIFVYTPPSYKTNEKSRYPVVYVFGSSGLKLGNLDKIVDTIFQKQAANKKQIAPECILVFIEANPMAPPNPSNFTKIVIPYVDKNYRTIANRNARLCAGFGFESASALMAGAAANEQVGSIFAASPLLFDAFRVGVVNGMSKIEKPVKVYVEWGRYDMFNPHENWDLRSMTKKFVNEIKPNKNIVISGGEVNDSTDWSSWQNRIHTMLQMVDTKK